MRSSIGLTAIIAVLGLAPAAAHATTFSGSCPDIKGKASFDQPLKGGPPADNGYHFVGTATCTGKVDGKSFSSAPVTVKVDGKGSLSCETGQSTTPGDGAITFANGVVAAFKMTFQAVASEVSIKITGIKSGSGSGSASFRQEAPADNLAIAQGCAQDGHKSLSFTANATVDPATPLDDGKAAEQPSTSTNSNSNSNSSNTDTNTSSSAPSDSSTPSNTGSSTQTTEKPKPKSKPKAKKKHKPKKKHKAKKKHKPKRKAKKH